MRISIKTLFFPFISVHTGREIEKVYVIRLQSHVALIITCLLRVSGIFLETTIHIGFSL